MKVRAIRQRAKRLAAGLARIRATHGPFLHFESMDDALDFLSAIR